MISAIILAGGKGTRLDPITREIPKPALPLGNSTIIGRIIEKLLDCGIRSIYTNVHYLPEKVAAAVEDYSSQVTVEIRHESKLSGPAGAIRLFADVVEKSELTLVISGDAVFDDSLEGLVQQHRISNSLITVGTALVSDGSRFGVFTCDEYGVPVSFEEKPNLAKGMQSLVSSGIYAISPDFINLIPDAEESDFGRDLIPYLLDYGEQNAVSTYLLQGSWEDIGDLEAYKQAAINSGCPVGLFPDSRIDSSAELLGDVIIYGSVTIGSGAVVRDSVLLPGSVIAPNQVICGAVVGSPKNGKRQEGDSQ